MIIQIDQYVTLEIQEYKGTYSLVEGSQKDGSFKPSFCKKRFGKAPVEKNVPLSVRIGDPQSMYNLAVMLAKYAKELGYEPKK